MTEELTSPARVLVHAGERALRVINGPRRAPSDQSVRPHKDPRHLRSRATTGRRISTSGSGAHREKSAEMYKVAVCVIMPSPSYSMPDQAMHEAPAVRADEVSGAPHVLAA
jgi:hypothetical protein